MKAKVGYINGRTPDNNVKRYGSFSISVDGAVIFTDKMFNATDNSMIYTIVVEAEKQSNIIVSCSAAWKTMSYTLTEENPLVIKDWFNTTLLQVTRTRV